MTQPTGSKLTLATKVNRLFEVYRARHEVEQTEEEVAKSLSYIIGRSVSADQVRALRLDEAAAPDPDLIDGLIQHFTIPPEYLKTEGGRAEKLDTQLRLLAAARDAGVKRLALRGGALDADAIEVILDIVKAIPTEDD
jgi:hypothetical protein